LTRTAGREDLSNIVRIRRLDTVSYHQRDQQVWIWSGHLMEAGEEEVIQGRPGNKHSRKIYRRCESAEVVLVEWLVKSETV